MTRYQTLVQLTEELVRQLDAEAARRGLSRSAIVREAVTDYLSESKEAEISKEIVEGYTRVPPGAPDAWGDLEAAADVLARETAERLNEEERRKGKAW
jgi:predicted transcriptional regulator